MDAAVAALIGAGIGVAGTVAAAWMQQNAQTRRELVKVAVDLALADYKRMIEHSDHGGKSLPPVTLYVTYHADLLRAVAAGAVEADTLDRIDAKQEALMRHIVAKENARREARAAQAAGGKG